MQVRDLIETGRKKHSELIPTGQIQIVEGVKNIASEKDCHGNSFILSKVIIQNLANPLQKS